MNSPEVPMKIPSVDAIDHANKFVQIASGNPQCLIIFGRQMFYNNVAEAARARQDIVDALAREFDSYAANQRLLNSWDPLDTKGIA